MQLELADIYDRRDLLSDVDICFCYSTAFTAMGPYLTQLSMTFGENRERGPVCWKSTNLANSAQNLRPDPVSR